MYTPCLLLRYPFFSCVQVWAESFPINRPGKRQVSRYRHPGEIYHVGYTHQEGRQNNCQTNHESDVKKLKLNFEEPNQPITNHRSHRSTCAETSHPANCTLHSCYQTAAKTDDRLQQTQKDRATSISPSLRWGTYYTTYVLPYLLEPLYLREPLFLRSVSYNPCFERD